MRRSDAGEYRHPETREPLELVVVESDGDEVVTGELRGGGDTFAIVRGIPRFCPEENYAENFGYQWHEYAETQLDSRHAWGWSEKRLFEETKWPRDLTGERILEAGAGAGRFTSLLAEAGANLFSFDYSIAIDSNAAQHGAYRNVSFAQANIYSPPYERGSFDKVLCLGVIQHCPEPRAAFESLVELVRPGGQIVWDNYLLDWRTPFRGKYYLRPLTRRLSPKVQHRFVMAHLAWTYPLTGWIHRRFGLRPGRWASTLLSVADFRGLPDIDEAHARELCELDTLDMLGPMYDWPQTVGTIRRWMEAAGLTDIEVHKGYNGVEARGRRPE